MTTLAEASEGGFQAEMENCVRGFAPRLAAAAGEAGVQEFVRQEIGHARRYGFSARDTIRFFLEAACVLGHRFDTDPQYPWAAEVLQLTSLNGEDQRADLLARHLYDYMDTVAGRKNELAASALRRLQAACPPRFEDLPALNPEAAADRVMEMYPAKYEYVGRARLVVLQDHSACPLQVQRSWSFRIAWAEPKITPPPSLVLRKQIVDRDFLFLCSSSQCLISIAKDDRDGTRKETI